MNSFNFRRPGFFACRRIKFSRIAALCCLILADAPASALPPNKIYESLAPSVWLVHTFDAQGKGYATGSAVAVDKNTVITNCHVLMRASTYRVIQGTKSYEATLEYADPDRDMCQLTVPNFSAPSVAIGDSEKINVGDRIYTLGSPRGLELTLSDGLISALRKNDAQRLVMIQISAPISPGSSGGGVFDEEARLIGITTAVLIDSQNLNIAIPINWLKELSVRSNAGGLSRFNTANRTATAAGDKATAKKITTDIAVAERTAIDKLAADRAAVDKAVADRIAIDRAVNERIAAEKAAADKIAIDRAVAIKIANNRIAIEKATAEKIAANRIAADTAAREKEAVDKTVADRMARDKAMLDTMPAEKAPDRRAPAPAGKNTPSGYAQLNDIDKFKRLAAGPGAEANYRRFLTYDLPRAFAVTDDGRTWGTWSVYPRNPSAPIDPSARVLWECANAYKQTCYLYAVDDVVVYRVRGN